MGEAAKGICTGFHQLSPRSGPQHDFFLPSPSPLKQAIPSTQEKSTKPFKAEPKSSPAKPPAHVSTQRHCSVSEEFLQPVLAVGSEELGESPALQSSHCLCSHARAAAEMPRIPPCPQPCAAPIPASQDPGGAFQTPTSWIKYFWVAVTFWEVFQQKFDYWQEPRPLKKN